MDFTITHCPICNNQLRFSKSSVCNNALKTCDTEINHLLYIYTNDLKTIDHLGLMSNTMSSKLIELNWDYKTNKLTLLPVKVLDEIPWLEPDVYLYDFPRLIKKIRTYICFS
jgi:hypothetical protein